MSHPICSYCGERVAIPCETKCEERVCDEEGQLETKLSDLGLIYLASPYSKFQPDIVAAYRTIASVAGEMLKKGAKVYSPIVHTHPIAKYADINPYDLSIWLPFDEAMMKVCDSLVIADMEGWADSQGIHHEIGFFDEHHKPIWILDHKTLALESFY